MMAATSAAAEPRHNAVSQELTPVKPELVPIRKPTKAPRMIKAFMYQGLTKHKLCHSIAS
jgi:hypothetical protein